MRNLLIISLLIIVLTGCKKNDEDNYPPIIVLKNTTGFTLNESTVPVGGQLQFGITATTGSAPLTNVRITRIADGQRIKEDDRGIFIKEGGLDYVVTYNKSSAEVEVWEFFVMNANRDSALTYRTVYLGEGSAYGAIYHYPSVKIGMQENLDYPSLLDVNNGLVYDENSVAGHEADIEILGFVYETSGIISPTLCCPGYTGTTSPNTFYPYVASWSVKNSILYDYNSSDNDLVSLDDFNQAQNDSLIVNSYKPASVSGLCKYCYTGKIIPFKTHESKYGLIHVKHSDTLKNGYMELEIKIQQ